MHTRVTVTHVVAPATWSWVRPGGVRDETHLCGICHAPTDGCCPTCALPGDACPMLAGTCSHAFHTHCILRWLEQRAPQDEDASAPSGRCPMCRQEWRPATASDH